MLWPETPTQRFRKGKLERLCVERETMSHNQILSTSSSITILWLERTWLKRTFICSWKLLDLGFTHGTRLRVHSWKVNGTNWTEILHDPSPYPILLKINMGIQPVVRVVHISSKFTICFITAHLVVVVKIGVAGSHRMPNTSYIPSGELT